MANSDYTARSLALPFCPTAQTETEITHLDTTLEVVNFLNPGGIALRIGSAALIDDEIVAVTGFADGPKIDIGYTYRIVNETVTGNGVHTESITAPGPAFTFIAGQEFDISPSDARFKYQVAIDAKYETNPEIPSYNFLVYGVDYTISSDWTLTILRNINTFLLPIVVRAQYRIVETSNVDTAVTVSINGQNAGTTYTLDLFGGTLHAFSFIRYTMPFGGGNVNLVSGTDYTRSGNVINFLVDYRALSLRKYMQIARGCCDTIPAEHVIDSQVWFFDDYLGSDRREYAGNETIGVKPLPRTTSGTPVPIAGSPPNEITFNFRFNRPYPPGYVRVNSQPWYTFVTMDQVTINALVLTWRHRNRITQADLLVDHQATSVTPEVGTTYRVDVYDAANTLVVTYAGITGETWTYTRAQAQIDSGLVTGAIESGHLILTAERDDLDSWQSYRIDFDYLTLNDVQADRALTWNIENYSNAQRDQVLSWNVLEAPDFTSGSMSKATYVVPGGESPVFSFDFKSDGTFTASDWDSVVRFSGTWVDTTGEYTSAIASWYQITSVSQAVGSATIPTRPHTMTGSFVIGTVGLGEYRFTVTFTPTASNPRNGESGYFGTREIWIEMTS